MICSPLAESSYSLHFLLLIHLDFFESEKVFEEEEILSLVKLLNQYLFYFYNDDYPRILSLPCVHNVSVSSLSKSGLGALHPLLCMFHFPFSDSVVKFLFLVVHGTTQHIFLLTCTKVRKTMFFIH